MSEQNNHYFFTKLVIKISIKFFRWSSLLNLFFLSASCYSYLTYCLYPLRKPKIPKIWSVKYTYNLVTNQETIRKNNIIDKYKIKTKLHKILGKIKKY